MADDSHVYYLDIGEGRWRGRFHFNIESLRAFLSAEATSGQKLLALFLHGLERLPGEATMVGEITCDPHEGQSGVARVEVGVSRLGVEIYRLRGHYALLPDGHSVDINMLERFGPSGSPLQYYKRAKATIDRRGERAVYTVPILGAETWSGVYEISDDHRALDARYRSTWGSSEELMSRLSASVPPDGKARRRWDRLLDVARELEALYRRFEAASDERAIFAYAYSVITRDLTYRLAEMAYDNPDWVVGLAEAFARRFVRAATQPSRAPRAWRLVFDAIADKRLTTLDQFLLPMAAHIIWDLPHALLDVGLVDVRGRSHVADFHRVNTVLGDAIDPLQDRLGQRYNPAIHWLDLAGRDVDERLSRYTISTARGLAWYNAGRLADKSTTAEIEAALERSIEHLLESDAVRGAASRVVRRVARLLQQMPRNPTAAATHFLNATTSPAASTRRRTTADTRVARYAFEMARQHSDATGLHALASDLTARLGSTSFGDGIAALTRRATWAETLQGLGDGTARYDLSTLATEALGSEERMSVLRALGVSEAQRAAIAEHQAVVARADEGLATLAEALAATSARLLELGIPKSAALIADRRGDYDPATRIYESTVPAFYRVPYDDVAWMIDPDRWDEVIDTMVGAYYLRPPVAGKNGLLREEVNLFQPFFDHHPLHLTTDLVIDIEETRSPRRKIVRYRLDRSVDGSFDLDEGFVSVEELPGVGTMIVVNKRLRIADNPVLAAMLKLNPSGLTWMLTYWMDEVSGRVD